MRLLLLTLSHLLGGILLAQSTISGMVIDAETREPLLGATVLIAGSTIGTTTDSDGAFVLSHTGQFPVDLVVSYLGYETQQVTATAASLQIFLAAAPRAFDEIVVTARRGNENPQVVPIAMTVLGAAELDNGIVFNVNRVKELVPSVQLYSSNPRNTTLNIRGLGSTFGLTNDGIDPGVGFYVDGVYYARPAATSLDFIDVRQIEVLRGPQATLFGKNTTAGSFNILTRRPTFSPSVTVEQSFGNYGFIQAKGSVSGPIVANRLAARLSFTGTSREGTLYNVRTEKYINTLNNQGVRAQLLYEPSPKTTLLLAADYSRQRPDGYAQVYAGSVTTQRAAFRQFDAIIADLNYTLPATDPFDRIVDHDTPWRSDQDMGGAALTGEVLVGRGKITTISAWRYWQWNSSNDRDFTGLSAISRSQAPSFHQQWSQEVHYSGSFGKSLEGLVGVFAFYQTLRPEGAHVLEAGKDQWRFVQSSQSLLWQTPGLLDGLTQETDSRFENLSSAVFGQLTWQLGHRVTVNPGLRLNYDYKYADFNQTVYGGLSTTDSNLIALQQRVFQPQNFTADVDDLNLSGQLTVNYAAAASYRFYGTYSLAFKPVGLNLGGLPAADGKPILDLAIVKPERVNHFELGMKSEPIHHATLNLSAFYTSIDDYQTNVQSSQLGVTRGYLANAARVAVKGAEVEVAFDSPRHLRTNFSVSYLNGRYVSFVDAPVPLEDTGAESAHDASGERLPGISKWSGTVGTEYFVSGKLFQQEGQWFVATDANARTGFSSSPTPSRYLNIEGFALVNARLGFRMPVGLTVFAWARNLTNSRYFEQLLSAGGNAGHYAAVLGDPVTFGLSVRYTYF
ncbi:iron complex outermembrane receptor protein [Neolewinella xylanilytica]|uniref:Iron complex outermembrane receptor protein n=1 Tax=Neolewinella xylanilytica TaxID=1514080 RepID=A0A2S6HZZ6_9BACT|nr:TonB-dependent receptor [Neolewinella xylanilytica]PPK84098.1 iron complex outermembrane receptor protein [Neolewinella xylanilytica]